MPSHSACNPPWDPAPFQSVRSAACLRRNSSGSLTRSRLAGISTPPFWLALLLITLFSVKLGSLPAGGMAELRPHTPWFEAIGQHLRFAVLPIGTLLLLQLGGYTRFMRAAMIETLRQDYVRTARAKGAPERRVVGRHALKNALIPIVTITGLQTGALLGGAVLTETVFAWKGIGSYLVEGVREHNSPVVVAGVLLVSVVFVLTNLVVDLLYHAIDPRLRREATA